MTTTNLRLQNKQLGAYRLLSLIGRGGMAEVWLALQLTLNRQVALKILPETPDEEGDVNHLVERFAREAQAVAQLDHPSILPVIDYGQALGYLYLVTPYVPGGTLQSRLKGESLARNLMLDLFQQVLDGVGFAHSRGIIHRDLKPGNILLYNDHRAVIADFGVAKIENDNLALTQTGMIVGSPEYMAPEQFMGEAEYRSDLYSLGVVLYQLLTNQVPFSGTSAWEIGLRHLKEALPLPHPLIPLPLEMFLAKALQKQASDRFASAAEMSLAFQQARHLVAPAELERRPPALQPGEPTVAFPTKIVQSKMAAFDPTLPKPRPGIGTTSATPPPEVGASRLTQAQASETIISPGIPVGSNTVKPIENRVPPEPVSPEVEAPVTSQNGAFPGSDRQNAQPAQPPAPPISPVEFSPVPDKVEPELRVPAQPLRPRFSPSLNDAPLLDLTTRPAPRRKGKAWPLLLILGTLGFLALAVALAVAVVVLNSTSTSTTRPTPKAAVVAGPTPSGSGSAGVTTVPTLTTASPVSVVATTARPVATSQPARPVTTTTTTTTASSGPVSTVAPGPGLTVKLTAARGTGAKGTAVLTDKGAGTVAIDFDMVGLGEGRHGVYIRQGSCKDEGQGLIKYELQPLVVGSDFTIKTTSTFKADFALLSKGNLYLDVLNYQGDFFYTASCGNLPTSAP